MQDVVVEHRKRDGFPQRSRAAGEKSTCSDFVALRRARDELDIERWKVELGMGNGWRRKFVAGAQWYDTLR
jgi:hypothetical protein